MLNNAIDKPLAATLGYIAALDDSLVAEVGALDSGWFRATKLCDGGATALEEGLTRSVARYPDAERRVAGAFFIGHYAWYLAGPAIGCYLAERRVPDMRPENVALRYRTYTWHANGASGESERIDLRLLSDRFAALPDDPAASHPDALILPDETMLREWLRTCIENHLAPLIDAIQVRTRLGQRAQWNQAADSLALMFQHAGEALGEAEHARAHGLALVKVPGSPLRNPYTGYVTLECQGHHETFLQRGGCCLYYKIDPGNNCSTCVLRSEADRNQRLLAYMAGKYAQASAA